MQKHTSVESEAKRLGRRLRLHFLGGADPELHYVEFQFARRNDVSRLARDAEDVRKTFSWTAVPRAFSLLMLDYVCWAKCRKGSFLFPDPGQEKLAVSIGNDRHKEDGLMRRLFREIRSDGESSDVSASVLKVIPVRGTNRPKRLAIKQQFLPPDCIDVFLVKKDRREKVDSDGICDLARRIRTSVGLHTNEQTYLPSGGAPLSLNEGHEASSSLLRSKAEVAVDWPANLSSNLIRDMSGVHLCNELKKNVIAVLAHPDYPQFMSVGGTLVRNPVWLGIPEQQRKELQTNYRIDGPTPPRAMRLDVLLIRRDNQLGRGEIYTYFSPDWETNLLHFRQWVPEDDPRMRGALNAAKVGRHWNVLPDHVTVAPVPGKFAVSVKPHPKHGDLFLYIFEFCSVRFNRSSDKLRKLLRLDPRHTNTDLWRDLRSLRNDHKAWVVNADAIRAVHELFSVNLGHLPNSFSRLRRVGGR